MTFNLLLFLFLFSFNNCGAYTETLYLGSNCEVEGKLGVCKALANCPAEYHSVRFNNTPAKKRCSFIGFTEVVCCEIRKTGLQESVKEKFNVKSDNSEINIVCSFNGTLPVQCCPSDQVYAAPLQDAACPPPPPLEHTNNIIKRKCLEYSQYGFPCMSTRGSPGQFQREEVCFRDRLDNRIVGGMLTKLFEYPHMVMLGFKQGHASIWENGGTLISERAVLTAAHAVSTTVYGDVRQVCVGLYDSRRACREELTYRVATIKPHSQYEPTIIYNDIAILLLASTVTMNEYVRPACLPYTTLEGPMNNLEVTGWGLTNSSGPRSNELQKATIDEFDNENVCAKKYSSLSNIPNGWRSKTMLCAGSTNPQMSIDSCQGDSGGPLQASANDSIACSYVVVGVVSSGIGCGIIGFPGIYTRVAGFTDWIVKEIWPKG